MKKLLLFTWLGCLLVAIGALFWHNEWKYSLPTPVPANYRPVAVGTHVNLGQAFDLQANNRPLFLHFYNPKCPCSRFNIPHFQALVQQYQPQVDFGVVVMAQDDSYTEEEIQGKLDLDIPVAFDPAIAQACGVYSTPQAVLLTADRNLYFRGNYNKSRYCTNKDSNYAQQAIDLLLDECTNPVFVTAATKSYGCQLPNCEKTTP